MKKQFTNRSGFYTLMLLAAVAFGGVLYSSQHQTTVSAKTSNNMNALAQHEEMMKSAPGAANAPFDLQFIDTMIPHHQAAIDMAKMAEVKAVHPDLKALARKIDSGQQKEVNDMRRWRDRWYPNQPYAMNMEFPGMMQSMKGMNMSGLEAATGMSFDSMFIDEMVPHHEGAIVMAQAVLADAQHPELKTLAQDIIKTQSEQNAQMNKWKGQWSGGTRR